MVVVVDAVVVVPIATNLDLDELSQRGFCSTSNSFLIAAPIMVVVVVGHLEALNCFGENKLITVAK